MAPDKIRAGDSIWPESVPPLESAPRDEGTVRSIGPSIGSVDSDLDGQRVYRDDSIKSAEVGLIQGKDVRNTVRVHCGGKPGIMNLDSRNAILHHNLSPCSIDCGIIRQQFHSRLNHSYLSVRVLNRQPKPVA